MVDALILVFVFNTVFAAWVVFKGGAEWLWRALADTAQARTWTPKKLRAMVASLWGVNAFALWTILDG